MSKIICDICGTSYADTAEQCPICGCVRPAQSTAVPDEGAQGGYTHVKGGRFSKTNVKKRTVASKKPEDPEKKDGKKGALILIIIAVILLVGIVAALVIALVSGAFDFLLPSSGGPVATPSSPTEPADVPCEGISVSKDQYSLDNIGDTITISCAKTPLNSTDEIYFASENEEIATVDNNGVVTAVSGGVTNVIITCGTVEKSCTIIVGEPSELVLTQTNVLLEEAGQTATIYDGIFPASLITWSSSNDFIATVADGVVTAQNPGFATITASYKDLTVTCQVECSLSPTGVGGITEDGGNSGITEDGGNTTSPVELVTWDIFGPLYYKNDSTLAVGETTTLYLGNSDGTGERINVVWTCKENDFITVSGNTVKAVKSNNSNPITLSTEYGGKVYKCIIRTCLP